VTTPLLPATYTEHAPPVSLREYVECFWTRGASNARNDLYLVLPDGGMDIVLGYRSAEVGAPPDLAFAVGTMTRALAIDGADPTGWVGVRFWPGRALPFLGMPASELTDLRVDMADVWPDRVAELQSMRAADPSALLAAFQRLLEDRLRGSLPIDDTVDEAVRAILRARGNLSIGSLALALGVTRQHLARRFAAYVGVSPKMFARVARVRRAIAKARVAAHVDWAALAVDAGYYDQSHLAGEVRELTGRSPSEWLASA
jgi:AraC-like DNA-binding protein